MICLLQRSRKVFSKWNFEVFELFLEPLFELVSLACVLTLLQHAATHLVQFVLALLRIVDGGLVSVVEEMSCSNKPITTVVTRATGDQNSLPFVQRLKLEDWYTVSICIVVLPKQILVANYGCG
jgi:hypothetical protein